ncbi:MAG: hypothetical protein QF907_08065 [Nitrospinota bacterium]|jgi:hypothetical protein|nr:hypothetical protein [Nitrospinota bacterium]|tara:strand:+ start:352 stop:630 length:279 start_codon:yes stop_codon:yes gene_type:complete
MLQILRKNIYILSKTVIVSGNIRMDGVSFIKTCAKFTQYVPVSAVPIHSGLPICDLRKNGKVFLRSAGGLDKVIFIQRKKYLKLSRPHFPEL